MRSMKFHYFMAIFLAAQLLLLPASGFGAEAEPWLSAGFLAFGDLYYVPSHHTEAGDGAKGGVVRRAYLTFNANLLAELFGRVRFEANQSGEFEDYDFDADFKDLYIGRNFGQQRLLLGLSPTPTFDLIESVWGMRYLARTPMDLQGVSSRATGVSLAGPLSTAATLSYRVMLDAGRNFGKDSDTNPKFMGAVTWSPEPRWTIDLYADYEDHSGPADRATLQAFAGYKAGNLRWGVQYSNQDRQDDPPLELASGFLVKRTSEKSSLIVRVDRLIEPSPRGDNIDYLPFDPSATATMLIAGLELAAAERISITPNAVVIRYDHNDAGERPETDLHLRLTLFLNFE